MRAFLLFSAVLVSASVVYAAYNVEVVTSESLPVLSYLQGTSTFQQVFNAAWVPPSAGTGGKQGLLVRSQNCSSSVGGSCIHCSGSGSQASVLTFAEMVSKDPSYFSTPVFAKVSGDSVVFGPSDQSDLYGTEDPRLTYDPSSKLYYLFYTAYGVQPGDPATAPATSLENVQASNSILLSLATTSNPTAKDSWTKHGAVFPGVQGSKSGALLIRDSPPHFLLWGDTDIRIANSSSLTSWSDVGEILLSPRPSSFDSMLVESGPNPMKLSTGDYLFLYNSADSADLAYHVGWTILAKDDPSKILARSDAPLFVPDLAWEQGVSPWTCNVANVVFLQGVSATVKPDVFRVYFGGADAVIGTALIQVTY
eukprot:ANDGO_02509.mRNA.1 hypothetical protein EMIHUDRAFT_206771